MGKVKSMMMDVEDFVYDFYDSYGNLTETPKFIVDKAIDKFGWSFGSYASEVLQNASEEMGGQWDWNKSVSQNLVGFEMTDDTIPF